MLEIRQLLSGLGVTALYVTHDQAEAFAVADRVAVIRDGVIEQRGTAEEVWLHPATEFVAGFLGFRTIVPAVVDEGVADAGPLGRMALPGVPDGPVRLVIRPDAVALDETGALEGVVRTRTFKGDHVLLTVGVGDVTLEVPGDAAVGDPVRLSIDPARVTALPAG